MSFIRSNAKGATFPPYTGTVITVKVFSGISSLPTGRNVKSVFVISEMLVPRTIASPTCLEVWVGEKVIKWTAYIFINLFLDNNEAKINF